MGPGRFNQPNGPFFDVIFLFLAPAAAPLPLFFRVLTLGVLLSLSKSNLLGFKRQFMLHKKFLFIMNRNILKYVDEIGEQLLLQTLRI